MAWEWVSPTATAVIAAAAIWASWSGGKKGQDLTRQLARDQIEHSDRAGATARTQERRAEAYVHVLEVVEQLGHWAQQIQPPVDSNPQREPLAVTMPLPPWRPIVLFRFRKRIG